MNYFDILLAKKLSGGGVQPTPQIVDKTVTGNPLNFITQFAQLAKETVISLAPIQDLHGYDYPWPAGGGKNKLPMTVDGIKASNTSGGTWSGNTYTRNGVSLTIQTDDGNNVIGILVNGTATTGFAFNIKFNINLESDDYILSVQSSFVWGASLYATGNGGNHEVSGDITSKSFTDNIASVAMWISNNKSFNNFVVQPMIRLATETDATFAPYSNYCPIDGRTETSLVGCGKNQLDISTLALRDVTGTGIDRMSFAPQKLKAGKWTFSFSGSQIMYITNVSDAYSFEEIYESPYILTANGNDTYMIRFAVTELSHITNTNFQLEYGEQATDYEPYHESNNLTIYFGEKVYGATVELEKGTVTVDREIVDLGTLTWTISSSLVCRTPISDKKDGIGTLVSSSYKYEPNKAFSTAIGEISDSPASSYAKNIFVKDPRVTSETTASQFASMVSGQQVCYPLATPRTITLAPNEISLLEGVNNISIDDVTGEITLTYKEIEFA